MASYPPLEVRVWGDLACFTRPEMKVERVTYPVMTPSAARGVLEAIFWKPEFDWRVREILVLREPRYFSILRNEVNNLVSERSARSWVGTADGFNAPEDRAQRHTLALRDVAYVIRADQTLRAHATDDIAKYRDQFQRRVRNGRCFATPYLGCREFSAAFGLPQESDHPIPASEPLGSMLFDIEHSMDGSGSKRPRFFEATLEHGVLHVPDALYARGT